MTPYLTRMFKHYYATVEKFRGHQLLSSTGSRRVVDIFVHLPALHTFVLCWSSTGARSVNRVFYNADHPDFKKVLGVRKPITKEVAKEGAPPGHDSDVTLIWHYPHSRHLHYVPVLNEKGEVFSVVRILDDSSAVPRIEFTVPSPQPEQDGGHVTPDRFNPSLIPHILGRWAGNSLFEQGYTSKHVIEILLRAFCSPYAANRAHCIYWHCEPESSRIAFHSAANAVTSDILRDVSDDLKDPVHMFGIIASHGVTEVLSNFPEDIKSTVRFNLDHWEPSEVYARLVKALGGVQISFYGIPLKIDDQVIGVFQCLSDRSIESFPQDARFARSCLSEMGRTIDKRQQSETSKVLRAAAHRNNEKSAQRDSVADLGITLLREVVSILVPQAKVTCGAVTLSSPVDPTAFPGVPTRIVRKIQNEGLVMLNESQPRLLFDDATAIGPNSAATLVIPAPIGSPFILFIHAPTELLMGRSLRAAIEALRATLKLAFETTASFVASENILSDFRRFQKLRSKIHDFQNGLTRLTASLAHLDDVVDQDRHDDLKRETTAFTSEGTELLSVFTEGCEELLATARDRNREKVDLRKLISHAFFSVADQYPKLTQRFFLEAKSDPEIITYREDLFLILVELFRNICKHFARTQPGRVYVNVTVDAKAEWVTITIEDDTPEPGALAKTTHALTNDETSTMRNIVRSMIEKVFKGYVSVREGHYQHSILVQLRIPTVSRTD